MVLILIPNSPNPPPNSCFHLLFKSSYLLLNILWYKPRGSTDTGTIRVGGRRKRVPLDVGRTQNRGRACSRPAPSKQTGGGERGCAGNTPGAVGAASSLGGRAEAEWHLTRSWGDTKLQEGHSFGRTPLCKLKREPCSPGSAALAVYREALDFRVKRKCGCYSHPSRSPTLLVALFTQLFSLMLKTEVTNRTPPPALIIHKISAF